MRNAKTFGRRRRGTRAIAPYSLVKGGAPLERESGPWHIRNAGYRVRRGLLWPGSAPALEVHPLPPEPRPAACGWAGIHPRLLVLAHSPPYHGTLAAVKALWRARRARR